MNERRPELTSDPDPERIRRELEEALQDPSSWNTECYRWAAEYGRLLLDRLKN